MAKKIEKKASKSVSEPKLRVPVGVKIIAVLYYMAAVISIVFGILAIIGSALFASYFSTLWPRAVFSRAIAFVGIVIVAFAVLFFFIARGLWKGQRWARIVAIIVAVLGFVSAILNIMQIDIRLIANLIIHGLIGSYLLFSKKVKKAFV